MVVFHHYIKFAINPAIASYIKLTLKLACDISARNQEN